MKKSKFNIVVPYHDKFIHYNMITKSIILSSTYSMDYRNSAYYDNGFFVDDSKDEIKESEVQLLNEQNSNNHLLLTLIPTLKCNLDCTYCYQHDLHNTTEALDNRVLSGILSQIDTDSDLSSVHIEWNGGEPLLETKIIRDYSLALMKLCNNRGIAYSSSISTNLYALNENILADLVSSNITSINTTLAGTSNVHDKYRLVRGGKEGSFNTVWKNIIKASQRIPVSVCVNVTAYGENDIYNLIDQLANIANDNLSLSFLLVENYGFGENSIFLEKETHFPIMLRLLEYALNKGIKAEINSNFGNKYVFCAAQLKNSFIIHPSGRIYKCANDYSVENSIGYVSDNGFLFTRTVTSNSPYKDKKCSSCKILPYCNGGCQFARESGKDYCPHEKNYLHELLRLYVSSMFGIA